MSLPFTILALSPRAEGLAVLVGAILVIVVGVWITIWSLRKSRSSNQFAAIYERAHAAAAADDPGPMVEITFHTYSGLLVYFTQIKHHQQLPARAALELLRGLHRFNLLRSLIPYYGSLFVPILSVFEYRKQTKIVKRALAREIGDRT